MDPDATLQEIRILANKYKTGRADDHEVDRLVDLMDALDAWIEGGGFLPRDWRRG